VNLRKLVSAITIAAFASSNAFAQAPAAPGAAPKTAPGAAPTTAPGAAPTTAPTAAPSPTGDAVIAQPFINAAAYLVVEATSGQVLAESNTKKRRDPASLTKLMTAYIVFDALYQKQINLSQRLRVPERAWKAEGSRLSIQPGTPITAEDMVRGLLIYSGNDAATALAISVAGNESEFVARMNREAKRLGMEDTNFLNPTGLTQQGQYSTAYDIGVLALALLRDFPQYAKFFAEKSFTLGGTTYENRNALLKLDPTVDGMKTGQTDAAGWCLVTTVNRSPRKTLIVLLGAPNEGARVGETQKLIDWAFTAYQPRRFYEGGKPIQQLQIWKSTVDSIPVGFRDDVTAINTAGKTHEITTELAIREPMMGPIAAGDKLGTLRVKRAGNLLYERDVVAFEAAPAAPMWKRMWHSFLLFLKSVFK
jgi:serine-type D-Ala-D-Ala carboxypeptidase (penicillin-binding protein 5/6)